MRLALLFVLLITGCSTLSSHPAGVFAGRVTDEEGHPVAGANVAVLDLSDEGRSVGAATDLEGLFAIGGLPLGRHEVEVQFTGMHAERFEIETGLRPSIRTVVLRQDTSVTDVTVCGAAC